MHFEPTEVLAPDATVTELLRPLAEILHRHPGATELCVNRPGEVFVEEGAQWRRVLAPELTLSRCLSLATAIATWSEQAIGPDRPLLSATLPRGERVQIVLPPAVDAGCVSLSIRIPGASIRTLAEYEADGAFARFAWARSADFTARAPELAAVDRELCARLEAGQLAEFLRLAVQARRNIAVVGDTGSGKTTLMMTLCQAIPATERLVTIEDVRELFLPTHANRVHLLYSKGGQGAARVTPAELIAATMRMKPDRVLLAELRGSEAFDFLKLLTTGHAGSITSFHAESCALALERYVFMAKEHGDAATFDPASLKRLVALTIDVVLHVVARTRFDAAGQPLAKERFVAEVAFDPIAKLTAQYGAARVRHAG